MAQNQRRLSTAEQAAMIWLSGGSCYWPSCGVPAIVPVNGKHRMNLEIAHIHAFDDGGPRADTSLSHEEREAWANKMLLCHPHHTEVDDDPEKYSVEKLSGWKTSREADAQGQLSALRVSESQLQELVTAAIVQQDDRVNQTLDRLEKSDTEAAAVIRELRDQLETIRRHGGLLDVDAVEILHRAMDRMQHLPRSAEILYQSASKLENIDQSADLLQSASQNLVNLGASAAALSQASKPIPLLADLIPQLQIIVNSFEKYRGNM
jgi:hypothetical protein